MHIEKHSDLSKSFYGKKTLIILVLDKSVKLMNPRMNGLMNAHSNGWTDPRITRGDKRPSNAHPISPRPI